MSALLLWPAMVGNSLTVERAALTRLVLVRIQVPQPYMQKTRVVEFYFILNLININTLALA